MQMYGGEVIRMRRVLVKSVSSLVVICWTLLSGLMAALFAATKMRSRVFPCVKSAQTPWGTTLMMTDRAAAEVIPRMLVAGIRVAGTGI